MNDIDKVKKFVTIQRKYASFFEWFKREKKLKEVGIVQCLFDSMAESGTLSYNGLIASEADPPDCIAKDLSEDLVGFEVRELVDQQAIEMNESGKEVYRDWNTSEVFQEIQNIIIEKDSKKYSGPYKKIILVIPTDEPTLNYKELKNVLNKHTFNKTRQINEAYLLFSYHAETQNYPFIKLNLLNL